MKRIILIFCFLFVNQVFANLASDKSDVIVDSDLSENIIRNKEEISNKFPKGLQFGLGLSAVSGINGFIGYVNKNFDSFLFKRIGIRFDFATIYPLKKSIESKFSNKEFEGLKIRDMDIENNHIGGLLDIYPFGNTWFLGGIRLTGGFINGKTKFNFVMNPELDSFVINGFEYKFDNSEIKAYSNFVWNYSAPYLGTGFDLGLFYGLKIFLDAGVILPNNNASFSLDIPIDSLKVYNDMTNTWENISIPGNMTNFINNKKEAISNINDKLKKIQVLPMIKFGILYRF